MMSYFAENLGISILPMFRYESVLREFLRDPNRNPNGKEIYRLIDKIHKGVALNPTQHFWQELLSLGSPFINKNFFSYNPAELRAIPEYTTHFWPKPEEVPIPIWVFNSQSNSSQ
jgi:hypothetical protein